MANASRGYCNSRVASEGMVLFMIAWESIQLPANNMYDQFEQAERLDSSKFWSLKDGHPAWMTDVCRKAHADMLPDDWRYEFIKDALSAIVDNESEDGAYESIEADASTMDLAKWLASGLERVGYCDQAIQEYGVCDETWRLLAGGQEMERHEVFYAVVAALKEYAKGMYGDDEEEDE